MMLTIYMFFLHFVADFLLQSREMAAKKSVYFDWLLKHLIIQLLVMFFGLMIILDPWLAYKLACFNVVFHGLIDWYVWKLYKFRVEWRLDAHYGSDETAKLKAQLHWEYWTDKEFYTTIGFDQFLHFSTIILAMWVVL